MPSLIEIEREQRRKANLEIYRLAGLPPIGGGSPTPEEAAAAEAKRIADEEAARVAEEEKHLSEAGKAALKAERDARKAAAKEAADLKARLSEIEAKQAEADAAKAKAEEEEAKRKGEFEQLANKRAEDLAAAIAERDAERAEKAALIEALKPEIDEQWNALPAEVTELYEGADDDVLAKRAHIARTRKLTEKLITQTDEKRQAASFGRTPKPNGTVTNLERGIEQGRRSGKYTA